MPLIPHLASTWNGAPDVLFYAVRILYYFMLMTAGGAMLLSFAIPGGESGAGQRKLLHTWSGFGMRGLLLAVLLFVFVHANRTVSGLGGGGEAWLKLLTETSTGQAWLGLIVLSFLGFAVIRLNDTVKIIWALLLLAIESFEGHAAASEHATSAIVSDFIHLACAAIWAGGVLLLLLLWKADREEAGRFAERFAAIAWITMAVLTVSGIVMTWLLIPSWLYLLYTDWGNWLAAKALIVLFVIALGTMLRARAKKRELQRGALLKLDGILMVSIIAAAGVITYLSPAPDSEPLHHHEMGEDFHYTLAVSPNAPGPNDVELTIWLPEDSGEPSDLHLSFVSADNPGRKPVEIELKPAESDEEDFGFPGFTRYYYAADGIKLPRPGDWKAKLVVTEADGEKLEREAVFSN